MASPTGGDSDVTGSEPAEEARRRTGSADDEPTLADEEWPMPPGLVDPGALSGVDSSAGSERDDAAPTGPPRRIASRRRVLAAIGLTLASVGAAAIAVVALRGGDGAANVGRAAAGPAAPPVETSTTEPASSSPGATGVEVPDVSGMELDGARRALGEVGLRVRVEREESERPPGNVLRQTPAAGSTLAEDGVVVLAVATDAPRVSVPDVVGLPLARALAVVREAELEPEVRTRSSSRPARTVLSQTPGAGTRAEAGTSVRLVVATPPPQRSVAVPGVVGRALEDARRELREAGLRSAVTRVDSERTEGTVVRQSPRPGVRASEGDVVELVVSSGPAQVAVPDVTGFDEASARAALRAAGFGVRVVDQETSDPAEDGQVVTQSPAGGDVRSPGSVVTITVARLA